MGIFEVNFHHKIEYPEVTSDLTSGWTMSLVPEAEMSGNGSWPERVIL